MPISLTDKLACIFRKVKPNHKGHLGSSNTDVCPWPSGGQRLSLAQTAKGFPDFLTTQSCKERAQQQWGWGEGRVRKIGKTAPKLKAFSAQRPEQNEPAAAPPGLRSRNVPETTTNFGARLKVRLKPLLHLSVIE